MIFQVHYRYDDKTGSLGQCFTDHALATGEMMYGKNGRAFVVSCRAVTPVVTKAARGRNGGIVTVRA